VTVPSSHGLANMIPSCWSLSSNGFDPELRQLFLIAMENKGLFCSYGNED